jgi:hypothetical protein
MSIETASPPGRLRRTAACVQLVLALTLVAAVFAQVYLIGAYIFGVPGALAVHRTIGFTAQGLEVLTFISSLVARRNILLSLGLAIVGTVQAGLANADRWIGALHPLAH